MNPCGHWVHVTKSASTVTVCGLAMSALPAVADGGSRFCVVCDAVAAVAAILLVKSESIPCMTNCGSFD